MNTLVAMNKKHLFGIAFAFSLLALAGTAHAGVNIDGIWLRTDVLGATDAEGLQILVLNVDLDHPEKGGTYYRQIGERDDQGRVFPADRQHGKFIGVSLQGSPVLTDPHKGPPALLLAGPTSDGLNDRTFEFISMTGDRLQLRDRASPGAPIITLHRVK